MYLKNNLNQEDLKLIKSSVKEILKYRILNKLKKRGYNEISESFNAIIDYNFKHITKVEELDIFFTEKKMSVRLLKAIQYDSNLINVFELSKEYENKMNEIINESNYVKNSFKNFRFWSSSNSNKLHKKFFTLKFLMQSNYELKLTELEKEIEADIVNEIIKALIVFYYKGLNIDDVLLDKVVNVKSSDLNVFNMSIYSWRYCIQTLSIKIFAEENYFEQFIIIKDNEIKTKESLELINLSYKI